MVLIKYYRTIFIMSYLIWSKCAIKIIICLYARNLSITLLRAILSETCVQIKHFHQWMEEGIVYPTMKCIRLNERTKLLQQFTWWKTAPHTWFDQFNKPPSGHISLICNISINFSSPRALTQQTKPWTQHNSHRILQKNNLLNW